MKPEDIDLGDEPIEVERRRRSGIVMSVRLSPEEADALQGIAEQRGITLSQVAREAIGLYLACGPQLDVGEPRWSGTATGGSLDLVYRGRALVVSTALGLRAELWTTGTGRHA